MAHTGSCGNAAARGCHCGGCAGARHGWPGAFKLAQPGEVLARSANRVASEHAWAESAKSRAHRPTIKRAEAAIDGAEADVVAWLTKVLEDSQPSVPAMTAQLIQAIGNVVSTNVLDALCNELEDAHLDASKRELAERHLFCSLLVEVAREIQQINSDIDAAIAHITDEILSYCIGRKEIKLPPALVKVVVKAAATGVSQMIEQVIDGLPVKRHLDALQQATEILAFLLCPAPERHEAVIRYCVRPLADPVVSKVIQCRLKEAMPEWMS
jgi:hypothetical protein